MKQLPKSILNTRPSKVSDAREWFNLSAKQIERKEKVRTPKPQRMKYIILQSKLNDL